MVFIVVSFMSIFGYLMSCISFVENENANWRKWLSFCVFSHLNKNFLTYFFPLHNLQEAYEMLYKYLFNCTRHSWHNQLILCVHFIIATVSWFQVRSCFILERIWSIKLVPWRITYVFIYSMHCTWQSFHLFSFWLLFQCTYQSI